MRKCVFLKKNLKVLFIFALDKQRRFEIIPKIGEICEIRNLTDKIDLVRPLNIHGYCSYLKFICLRIAENI